MPAIIAPLTSADASGISTLAGIIWREHYAGIISAAQIEYMLMQRYQPALIHEQLSNPDIWWKKLVLKGTIIGFSCCIRTARPDELKIDKLYIHRSHRRQGYGARLVADALRTLQKNNLQSLILTVNKQNHTAISAYRHYGFEITGDSIVDIGGGFFMNDYLMILDLSRWKDHR